MIFQEGGGSHLVMYLKLRNKPVDGIDAAGTYITVDDNGTWKAYPATGFCKWYSCLECYCLNDTGDPSSVL